jgi:hypothetical protein
MTVIEFLNYLLRGQDTGKLAADLAWAYELRQVAATCRARDWRVVAREPWPHAERPATLPEENMANSR